MTDTAFVKYCKRNGINPAGQFADDIRPAFDAGYAAGQRKTPGIAKLTIKALNLLATQRDQERAKNEADELLCDLLKGLGYSDVVAAYREVPGL